MSRRHDSLIPLSHQHQHALALAVIIRRRFGIEKGREAWLEEQNAKVEKAYAAELSGHFEVEESVLFPAMERNLGKLDLVGDLLDEHTKLHRLFKLLKTEPSFDRLDELSLLLERHVRKEERQLFVEFEKRMPADEALKLGREIESRLARACPRL
jgi:hemerythrin-like domain-containing protein